MNGYAYASSGPVTLVDPDGRNAYDSQTPCAKYDCGAANVDHSDTASENATNNEKNHWHKPEPKKTTDDKNDDKRDDKNKKPARQCHLWCALTTTALGFAATAGCESAFGVTGPLGAVACAGLGGGITTASAYLWTNWGTDDWSWEEFAIQFAVGAISGAAIGAVGGGAAKMMVEAIERAIQMVGPKLAVLMAKAFGPSVGDAITSGLSMASKAVYRIAERLPSSDK
jgi:hypothetical protein